MDQTPGQPGNPGNIGNQDNLQGNGNHDNLQDSGPDQTPHNIVPQIVEIDPIR